MICRYICFSLLEMLTLLMHCCPGPVGAILSFILNSTPEHLLVSVVFSLGSSLEQCWNPCGHPALPSGELVRGTCGCVTGFARPTSLFVPGGYELPRSHPADGSWEVQAEPGPGTPSPLHSYPGPWSWEALMHLLGHLFVLYVPGSPPLPESDESAKPTMEKL